MNYWDNKEAEYLEQQRKVAEENFCGCCCCTGSCMDDMEDPEVLGTDK